MFPHPVVASYSVLEAHNSFSVSESEEDNLLLRLLFWGLFGIPSFVQGQYRIGEVPHSFQLWGCGGYINYVT